MPERIKRFLKGDAGVVAVIFAMALPMLVAAGGMAVDLAQAYDVKNRLGNALDKAALAGGGADTEANAKAIATAIFKANVGTNKLGVDYTIEVSTNDWAHLTSSQAQTITVKGTASVPTTFMSALGQKSINVGASSTVQHDLAGVEAVLVLDVTGSMDDPQISGGSTSKITALKNAIKGTSTPCASATTFLDIIFCKIADTKYIKIGVVPFSDTVNVGPLGLGLDASGNVIGVPFIDKPAADDYVAPSSSITWKAPGSPATQTNNWWGCITERAPTKDTDDSAAPNWGMYRYPKMCGGSFTPTYTEGQCEKTCTTSGGCTSGGVHYNKNQCMKTCSATGGDSTYLNGSCCPAGWSNKDPNNACTQSPIQPLTNNKTALTTAINGLVTGGNTYGNVGMVWGYHVISPTSPYMEGVSLSDNRWSKTVIFMSDGDNTVNSTYSAYGKNSSLTPTDENNKFLAVCTSMKNAGITIYTISFGQGVSTATKTMFKSCASSPSSNYYFDSTSTPVSTAFTAIAKQLAQLHIVN